MSMKQHCSICDHIIPKEELYMELKVIKRLDTEGTEFGDDTVVICRICMYNSNAKIMNVILEQFDKLELDD